MNCIYPSTPHSSPKFAVHFQSDLYFHAKKASYVQNVQLRVHTQWAQLRRCRIGQLFCQIAWIWPDKFGQMQWTLQFFGGLDSTDTTVATSLQLHPSHFFSTNISVFLRRHVRKCIRLKWRVSYELDGKICEYQKRPTVVNIFLCFFFCNFQYDQFINFLFFDSFVNYFVNGSIKQTLKFGWNFS